MSPFLDPPVNGVFRGKPNRPATALLCAVALPGGLDEVSEASCLDGVREEMIIRVRDLL